MTFSLPSSHTALCLEGMRLIDQNFHILAEVCNNDVVDCVFAGDSTPLAVKIHELAKSHEKVLKSP